MVTAPRFEGSETATSDHVKFLHEAARYFEGCPTNGEDRAHWANVYNAENCRKAASSLATLQAEVERLRGALIATGRHVGAGLADNVSTDFLMLLSEEARLFVAQLRQQLAEKDEALATAFEEAAQVAEQQAATGFVNGPATTLFGQAYQGGCRDSAKAIRARRTLSPSEREVGDA